MLPNFELPKRVVVAAKTGPHDPEFKIKSLARKLSKLVTAMANPNTAQKSHFTHAERYEANLDPEVWLSQFNLLGYKCAYLTFCPKDK